MIETNIRVLAPRTDLYLWTRCARIVTQDSSPKMIEKVCNKLAYQGLAAVYCPTQEQLLVFTQGPVSPERVEEENWIVEVEDGGKYRKLQFSQFKDDALLLAQLIERHVLIEIKRRLLLQTINSPRILYKTKPFRSEGEIDVYRRYEVSAIPIEDVGVGISVDVGVTFYTHWTVEEFFRDECGQKRFESLSQRQVGQRGTLRYNSGRNLSSCYFDKFSWGITCATTGRRIVKGEVYDSLLEYYQQKHPYLKIDADDCVAMVSFRGIDQPQPVAAKLLHLRVTNDSLPRKLKQVDKFAPKERVKLINNFWYHLGTDLLGNRKPPVLQSFWQPHSKKVISLLPPEFQFSSGVTLPAPQKQDYTEFQEHYRQRLRLLRKVGCLDTPILMQRVVHFAIPNKVPEEMRGRLIRDVNEHLCQLTKKPITPEFVPYETLDEAFLILKRYSNPGVVVFVFDDESPETYYKVAYELSDWRVKRITLKELENKFNLLKSARNQYRSRLQKAEKDWDSFTTMITLDVLQQMDCVFWGFKDEPVYDAHLAIDVGRDKRHFALSLLIPHPSPCITTVVKQKFDHKHETINETILGEEIVKLCNRVSQRNGFQPIRSLLVLRDGRECGNELKAIYTAKKKLKEQQFLTEEAIVDIVDFHKRSGKKTRLWKRPSENTVEQILDGKGFFLDSHTVVLATTGAPTLHQGTAAPIMLVGQSDNVDMVRVTKAVYASTHLNFSNPNVAQRLPLELKRTDDELKTRDSQEIRRIR